MKPTCFRRLAVGFNRESQAAYANRWTAILHRNVVNNMEELKDLLVKKISTLVESADENDVQLLDVMNRLLGTVTNFLLAQQDRSKDAVQQARATDPLPADHAAHVQDGNPEREHGHA